MNKNKLIHRVLLIYLSAMLISMFTPNSSFAQSQPSGIDEPTQSPSSSSSPSVTPIQPAQGISALQGAGQSSKQVNITVIITNKKTKRYLGSVKLQIGERIIQNLTDDPPAPGGYTISGVSEGRQAVIAERYGYSRYHEVVDIKSETGYFDLKIEMEALPGVPDVEKMGQNNYWGNVGNYGFPANNYTNPTSWGNSYINNSSINPFTSTGQNYYGYSGSQNYPYSNNYQNPYPQYYPSYGANQNPLSQNYNPGSIYNNTNNNTNNNPYTLTNQNYDLSQIKDYQVVRSRNDGNYYIILGQNTFDYRQLFFVDNGGGQGGLVFFSAASSAQTDNYFSNQSGNWYVGLYERDQLGAPAFRNEVFSRISFSPQEYANVINGQITSNFWSTFKGQM